MRETYQKERQLADLLEQALEMADGLGLGPVAIRISEAHDHFWYLGSAGARSQDQT